MPAQVPLGTIVAFAGSAESIPDGWLPCDGSVINSGTYPHLITLLGTNVTPDLRGRTLIGAGTSLNNSKQPDGSIPNFPTSGFEIGAIGGECTHQLATTEVPSHTHTLTNETFSEAGGGHNFPIPPNSTNEPVYDSPDSAQVHNNMQPYYVVNYMICATD